MNKKRVGLLTYHHTTNFGSLLQSYALYRTVINMGFDCEVIDYRNSAVESREFIKRFYNCNNLHELKGHLKYGGYKKKKAKAFSEFLLEKIKISEKSYSLENISEVNDIYDCFLIGSDLVWDFSINGHDTTYMLDFAKNDVSKLAYASSVGSLWQGEEKKDVITLLNKFNAIGVRESAICDMLKSELIIPVEFVCDPTMLFSPREWDEMTEKRLIKHEYVLCYMADENLSMYKDAIEFGKRHGLPVYLISYDWVPKHMIPIRPYQVGEFLSLIKYANTIFTASYHGLLFSLYFQKNFYYYNRGWKERMKSISSYLGLSGREHWKGEDEDNLDYNRITSSIEELRKQSLNILRHYLNK